MVPEMVPRSNCAIAGAAVASNKTRLHAALRHETCCRSPFPHTMTSSFGRLVQTPGETVADRGPPPSGGRMIADASSQTINPSTHASAGKPPGPGPNGARAVVGCPEQDADSSTQDER